MLVFSSAAWAGDLTNVGNWGRGGSYAMIQRGDLLFAVGEAYNLNIYEFKAGKLKSLGQAGFSSVATTPPPYLNSLAIQGDYLCAGSPDGLFFFDISDPTQPKPLRRYAGEVRALSALDSRLLVLRADRIQVYEVTTAKPVQRSLIDLADVRGMTVQGQTLWVVDQEGLKSYDFTVPDAPQ